MRHTAATLMIQSGVNMKVISETLGHSSIRNTLDLYGHLLDDQKQQVTDAMDEMLGGL
jgi:integrase